MLSRPLAILGTGVDLVNVARIRAALENPRTGARFRARIFTAAEQAYCDTRGRGRYESYAVRFAAKEAVMKALGSGWSTDVGWLDAEVVRVSDGPPSIALHGAAAAFARRLGVARLHLALTHTAELAVAYVVAEA